jgi:hypothetical protein
VRPFRLSAAGKVVTESWDVAADHGA